MSLGNWMEARWKYDRGRRFCNFLILLQVSKSLIERVHDSLLKKCK